MYSPLVHEGRLDAFHWQPVLEDRIGMCMGIFRVRAACAMCRGVTVCMDKHPVLTETAPQCTQTLPCGGNGRSLARQPYVTAAGLPDRFTCMQAFSPCTTGALLQYGPWRH